MRSLDTGVVPARHAQAAAARFADRLALIDGQRQWTHGEFWTSVERLARGLRAHGLRRGDRVVLWMHNRAEMLLAGCAIEAAGLVRVPLNARLTSGELARTCADCEPRLLVVDSAHANELPGSIDAICVDADEWPSWFVDDDQVELYCAEPADLCSLNYTSGSTGEPKGVMLSHRNWAAVYRNMLANRDIQADDRLLHIGPLSHASGAYFLPWFLRGAASIISAPRIGGLLASIEQHRATVLTCVPTLLTRVLQDTRIDRFDLSSLRQIGYGAEPISPNTLRAAQRRFGPVLVPNYGLTEAMMTVCTLPAAEMLRDGEPRLGVLGRPYHGVEVVLRNEAGHPVADGEVGELTVRADHVMQGYWRKPAETALALRDGWLWSGDLARREPDGVYVIAGRRKDMLICGGFNIYPQEVAMVIAACPGVDDVAVLGLQDEQWGEIPVAFVAGQDLQQRELVAWSRPQLGLRTPKRWFLCSELPRTVAGKIDIQQLRAELLTRTG